MFLWLVPALNFIEPPLNFWDIFFSNCLRWSRGLLVFFFSLLAEAFKSDWEPCCEPGNALLLLELTPPASSSSEVTSSSSSTSISTGISGSSFSSSILSSSFQGYYPSSSCPPAPTLSSLILYLANLTQVLTEIL